MEGSQNLKARILGSVGRLRSGVGKPRTIPSCLPSMAEGCFCVSAGLGEAWGHSSRTSPLDNVGRELGSHLLQV